MLLMELQIIVDEKQSFVSFNNSNKTLQSITPDFL